MRFSALGCQILCKINVEETTMHIHSALHVSEATVILERNRRNLHLPFFHFKNGFNFHVWNVPTHLLQIDTVWKNNASSVHLPMIPWQDPRKIRFQFLFHIVKSIHGSKSTFQCEPYHIVFSKYKAGCCHLRSSMRVDPDSPSQKCNYHCNEGHAESTSEYCKGDDTGNLNSAILKCTPQGNLKHGMGT